MKERVFNEIFPGREEGQRESVTVTNIGRFEDVMNRLSESRGTARETAGLRSLLGVLSGLREHRPLPDGRSVERSARVLVCGGFVRDVLLGKHPKDIDFATSASYEEVRDTLSEALADRIESGEVALTETGRSFQVLRIRFQQTGEEYEVESFRHRASTEESDAGLEKFSREDAEHRDFTANALFYDPSSGNVYDYVGGIRDIRDRRLRFVGDAESRIREDPLRLLRFVRFLNMTGFKADSESADAVRNRAGLLHDVAIERVREELSHVLLSGNVGSALRSMKEYGLLREILPEVDRLSDCPQSGPYHLEGDVFTHTALVGDNLPDDASLALRYAAMLHDVGKPDSMGEKEVTDENGITTKRITFYEHDKIGVELSAKVMRRLNFPHQLKKRVSWLEKHHLRIFNYLEFSESKAAEIAESEYADDLFRLAEADMRGTRAEGRTDEDISKWLEAARSRLISVRERVQESTFSGFFKRYGGNFILKRYAGATMGPSIGTLKRRFKESIRNGEVEDTENEAAVIAKLDELAAELDLFPRRER